jgi:hypothetical protein
VADFTVVLSAYPEVGPYCAVHMFEDSPLSLDEHAAWIERVNLEQPDFVGSLEQTRVALPASEAIRIDGDSQSDGFWTTVYLFEPGDVRYALFCVDETRDEDDYMPIAESIELLADEPPPSDVQRVEMPEAGVAVSLPSDWDAEVEMESLSYGLPPEYGEAATAPITRMLTVYMGDAGWCSLYQHDNPMSLEEQAEWHEHLAVSNPESPTTVDAAPVRLPAGDAIQLIETSADDWVIATYLLDSDAARYQLTCATWSPPDDHFLFVAESIEVLGDEPAVDVPPDLPADAVAWEEVRDFGSVVPVTDLEVEASLMSARCERALWIEFADGTFEERFECTLNDEPVDPPEWQATWPTETVTVTGGECEWLSDFWTTTDGSEVWASSYSLTVDPDGTVVGAARYAPELLECEVE